MLVDFFRDGLVIMIAITLIELVSLKVLMKNVEVVRSVQNEREIVETTKSGKLQYLGYVVRGEKYRLL